MLIPLDKRLYYTKLRDNLWTHSHSIGSLLLCLFYFLIQSCSNQSRGSPLIAITIMFLVWEAGIGPKQCLFKKPSFSCSAFPEASPVCPFCSSSDRNKYLISPQRPAEPWQGICDDISVQPHSKLEGQGRPSVLLSIPSGNWPFPCHTDTHS